MKMNEKFYRGLFYQAYLFGKYDGTYKDFEEFFKDKILKKLEENREVK